MEPGCARIDAGSMPTTTLPRPHSSALRKGRRSLAGQAYLVTFTTHDRRRLFAEPALAMAAARAVEDPRVWVRSQLLAWVLMPDHWHAVVLLGDGDDLSLLVQRLKTNTARAVRQADAGVEQVWAVGFHDHALRADEALVDAARYIVCNPVHAGLVRRVGDYPFWNAAWVELWESGRELRRNRTGALAWSIAERIGAYVVHAEAAVAS